jgi:hypothetical protein
MRKNDCKNNIPISLRATLLAAFMSLSLTQSTNIPINFGKG